MKQLYALLIMLSTTTLYGQVKQMDVIATAGGFAVNESAGITLSWTLGEPIIATLSNSEQSLLLTQGFQQGSLLGTGIDIPVSSTQQVSVYPNPASSKATISLKDLTTSSIEITIYSLTGAIVLYHKQAEPISSQLTEIPLQISHFKPGLYLIRVTANGSILATLKLVKE